MKSNPPSASGPPQSSTTSTFSLFSNARPRARRLNTAPGGGEQNNNGDSWPATDPDGVRGTQLISPLTTPRPSRRASPIPSKHPSRSAASGGAQHTRSVSNGGPLGGWTQGADGLGSPSVTSGLWGNSWSTLQGLASNLLTGDVSEDGSQGRPRKRAIRPTVTRRGSRGGPRQWGPAPETSRAEEYIGTGSQDARAAMVRAKRREDLLSMNGDVLADSLGNFKRRTSDERRGSSSAPPTDHERESGREALIYVHHVRPHDTLAGVIIQFNCQPVAFRRANRLWPNDSIQTRKTVVLPVDACAVKGRPVAEPCLSEEVAPLGGTLEPASDASFGWDPSSSNQPSQHSPSLTSHSHSTHDDPPWTHDSWVELDGHPAPVEIARLPRRTLGFFPPRRRKSVSFSDLDTPSASFDLSRLPARSPSGRRSSRSDTASEFAQKLHGPGGVGTLGASVRSPGPELDRFNRYLAPHLPDVTPRDESGSRAALTSTAGTTHGLDHVGSAIEGWVRKLATRASAAIEPPSTASRLAAGTGDLIELSDGFDGSDDGNAGRGRDYFARRGDHDGEGGEQARFTASGRGDASGEQPRRRKKGD